MNKPLAITAFVDAETLARVEAAAEAQGSSVEDFAAEAIRAAATREEDRIIESVRDGRKALAEGDWVTHEQMVAELRAIVAEPPRD